MNQIKKYLHLVLKNNKKGNTYMKTLSENNILYIILNSINEMENKNSNNFVLYGVDLFDNEKSLSSAMLPPAQAE